VSDRKRYRFNRFVLDTAAQNLVFQETPGSAEIRTPRGQAFDLIVHLIQNRDHSVRKSELWAVISNTPGKSEKGYDSAIVDQALLDARKALRDTAQNPVYIAGTRPGQLKWVFQDVQEEPASGFPGGSQNSDAAIRTEPAVVHSLRDRETIRVSRGAGKTLGTESERAFLEAARDEPSLHVGGRSIECKLFPTSFWGESRRRCLYLDEPDAEQRIELRSVEASLPPNETLDALMDEIRTALAGPVAGTERNALQEALSRLTKEGSNAYPRVVGLPRVEVRANKQNLIIEVGPSRYGIALIEEKRLTLPTAIDLRSHCVLNSLAVRVALVYEMGGSLWVECHQRKGGANATYKDAWDVSAAGYIDPENRDHRDPLDSNKVSPWRAAASELVEELGIPGHQLFNREHCFFFGMGRNDPTGQLDLLAYYRASSPPAPDRPVTARVQSFDRCRLEPESIARFIKEKRYWVPTAILTLVLTLEAFGYSIKSVDQALAASIQNCSFAP